MQIILIDTDRIYLETMPTTVSGKYTIGRDVNGTSGLLPIEADTERQVWVAKKNEKIRCFRDNDIEKEQISLEADKTYEVCLGDQETRVAYLMVLDEKDDFQIFQKYRVADNSVLAIGRTSDQQICLNNPLVSGEHLKLSFQNHCWAILEAKGKNGTFVNSVKIDGAVALSPGDVINVLFYKIVVGYDFIAINNPNGTVSVDSSKLTKIQGIHKAEFSFAELEEKKFYYRSPRFVEKIITRQINVDMPSAPEKSDDTPLLLTIAPAMLMGLASLSTGVIGIINIVGSGGSFLRALPTVLMSVSMLGGMVVFPIIMKKRVKRKSEEKEQERQTKYLRYLQSIRDEIKKIQSTQEKKRNELLPEILEYTSREDFWDRSLWERTIDQEDFLTIRLGLGNMTMDLDISFPEERFTIEEDILREEMFRLQKEERLLLNVPISVSLREEKVFGVVGDLKDVRNVLNTIFLQIMLLHSYDEVKVIFLHDENDDKMFRYVSKAQHIWDDKFKKRFMAVTGNNLRELNIEMGSIIRRRIEESSSKKEEILPHYIIVSTSKQMTNRCSFIAEIFNHPEIRGVSVICAYDEIRNLPKECHMYAAVGAGSGTLLQNGSLIGFKQDIVSVDTAEKLVGKMTNYALDLQKGKYDLPEVISFMDLYNANNFRHLNIIQRWGNNNPVNSLRAPIGIDTNGEVFYLDLHEKMHGPHGLVAGMTGSGKSEFLITYILSMAINYHPDEVAFVLIDYKGSGLAGAFDNEQVRLPHLAGTITNLDESAVTRAILSIKSELKKRQLIFKKARDIANDGTMDIYKYQKLYREGKVTEPVPHLFIVADEFAELKSQNPEFLEQLISTARIGRSLGVHLILATQKPNGVVNEQIWANSRFKVCLKVQDKADSIDMLKRPDAAELKETGRFYLQVGYNELFELGQSAWTGAPYIEQEVNQNHMDEAIEMIDELGNVVEKIKGNVTQVQAAGIQIVQIMEHLVEIADFMKTSERQLWLPELPSTIMVDEVQQSYPMNDDKLNFIIGEVDDPYNQKRMALAVNLIEKGNVLLYGAVGSGEEMFITTLLYAMYKQCSANELNVYLMDFGSEFLKNFEKAPQTKTVIVDGDDEKVSAMFAYLQKEIRNRKHILSEQGHSFEDYYKNGNNMPAIVVVVNNYLQFVESYEKYNEIFGILSREGQKYGVFFVITATSSNAVRYRIAQNFTNVYVLKLNDKSDYISILGNTGGVYPSAAKGRGIIKHKDTYSFQVASVTKEENEYREFILNFCEQQLNNSDAKDLAKMQSVPKVLLGRDIRSVEWGCDNLPLGINMDTLDLETVNLAEMSVLSVLAEKRSGLDDFVAGLIDALADNHDSVILFNDDMFSTAKSADSVSVTEEHLIELFDIALQRNNTYKTSGEIDPAKIIVIIQNYSEMMNVLTEDGKDKLKALLLKVQAFWNIAFIVCDTYDHAKTYSLENWFQKSSNKGFWIGAGMETQVLFKAETGDVADMNNSNTAYLFENENVKMIRIITGGKGDQKNEK